jgi:hypothetical protein
MWLLIPCWSVTSQVCLTQGTTCSTRPVFWQWHAKSVSSEQPSTARAEVRQLSCERKEKRARVSFETRYGVGALSGQASQSIVGYWIVGRWWWHRRRARQQQQRDAFWLWCGNEGMDSLEVVWREGALNATSTIKLECMHPTSLI